MDVRKIINSRMLLFVYVAVPITLIMLIIFMAVAFQSYAYGKSPSGVAERWMDAWAEGDGITVLQLTVSDQTKILRASDFEPSPEFACPEIIKEVIMDNEAYVVLEFPDKSVASLWLAREDGKWKVDMFKTLEEFKP